MLWRSSLFVIALAHAVSSEDDVCTDWRCREIAEHLTAGINYQINPCEDFYGYVCGPENTQRVDMTGLMIDFMDNIPPSNPAEEQAHIYYTSCISQGLPRETRWNFGALNKMVQDLGGWRDDGDLSNFGDIMRVVHQVYAVEVFFSWKVTQDLENPTLTIATISLDSHSSDIFLKSSATPDRFSDFVMTLKYMWNRGIQGIRAPGMKLPMTEIIDLHQQLQIRPSIPSLTRKVAMTELNEMAGFIDWEHFFETAYDEVGVQIYPLAERVQIEFPETLIAVAAVVRQYMEDPVKASILMHYIILRALFDLGQNLATADENLEARCIDEGFTELTPIFNSIFVKAVIPRDSLIREDVTRMYFILKRALVETLPELTQLNEDAVIHLTRELGSVHFFAGYMNSTFEDEHFARRYAGLNLGKSFIENKVMIREFNKKQNTAHMPRYQVEDFLDNFRVNEVNSYYSRKRNSIYLPVGLMMSPFFDINYPDYVKYGVLGAVLSHELSHALMAHLTDIIPQGSGATPAEEVFRERAKCFENQYAAFGDTENPIDGVASLEENIGDNIGIGVALHAYKTRGWERALLPGLEFTREQLFFIAYAHSFCARPGQMDSLALLSNTQVPDNVRVLGALANNVDFANAFSCPANSVMNPEFRCSPWE